MRSTLSTVLTIVLFTTVCDGIRRQSVGVKGRLLCGLKPLEGASIKLFDEDAALEMDDVMGETKTNKNGQFLINGTEIELTHIEPRITIYHNCNYKWICKREVTLAIPRKYINHSRKIKKWFDIGTINMETIFSGEEHNCFRLFS